MHAIVEQVVYAFQQRGSAKYGEECVTQLQHALQSAQLAKESGASDQLIAAALMHDIGHILDDDVIPTKCDENLDDKHESIGYRFLHEHFGDVVADPVRLHVLAKRYLCTTDPQYESRLSPTSRKSYYDQGGRLTSAELEAFESEPFYPEALMLRQWDDTAKDPTSSVSDISAFVPCLESAVCKRS